MKIFSPKGYSLRDYCYINLFVYTDSTELLHGGSFIDKIKFLGLKDIMNSKMQRIIKAIYTEHCFDFSELKDLIWNKTDNGWDSLLNNIILRVVVKCSTLESENSNDQLLKDILAYFTLEVQKRHEESDEILELKNIKMELETSMDLLIAEACFKNSKGKFKRFR